MIEDVITERQRDKSRHSDERTIIFSQHNYLSRGRDIWVVSSRRGYRLVVAGVVLLQLVLLSVVMMMVVVVVVVVVLIVVVVLVMVPMEVMVVVRKFQAETIQAKTQ